MKYALVLILACLGTRALAETVLFRDGATPVNCTIVSWSTEGLRISKDEISTQEVIPWYLISKVSSEEIGVMFQKYLTRGEMLWRAKLRLLRGDIALAAPLFREVFMQLKNSEGLDAYLAAEGLLRCNLATGNLNESIAPWLVVVDHVQSGRTSQLEALASIIDPSTLLCPHLPPVWNASFVDRSVNNLELRSDVAQSFYAIILSSNITTKQTLDGPSFLQHILLLKDAEQNVSSELKKLQPWQQCWLLFAEASGLQKKGHENEAMLKFAEVIATYETTQPWLAGASISALLESFDRAGDTKIVNNIQNEFSRVLPNHPLRKE